MIEIVIPNRPLTRTETGELADHLRDIAAVLDVTQPEGSAAELFGHNLMMLVSVFQQAVATGRREELESLSDAQLAWVMGRKSVSHPGKTVGEVVGLTCR